MELDRERQRKREGGRGGVVECSVGKREREIAAGSSVRERQKKQLTYSLFHCYPRHYSQ